MKMDETLYSVQEKILNFAVIYLVDITKVPDFNKVSPNQPYPIHHSSHDRPLTRPRLRPPHRCMRVGPRVLSSRSTGRL